VGATPAACTWRCEKDIIMLEMLNSLSKFDLPLGDGLYIGGGILGTILIILLIIYFARRA